MSCHVATATHACVFDIHGMLELAVLDEKCQALERVVVLGFAILARTYNKQQQQQQQQQQHIKIVQSCSANVGKYPYP